MLNSQLAAVLTIPNGGTDSNIIGTETLEDAIGFILQAPAVLTEVVTMYVSWDGITFAQLMDSTGTAIKCPVATTAINYGLNLPLGPAQYFKLTAGAGVGGDRIFHLMKQTLI